MPGATIRNEYKTDSNKSQTCWGWRYVTVRRSNTLGKILYISVIHCWLCNSSHGKTNARHWLTIIYFITINSLPSCQLNALPLFGKEFPLWKHHRARGGHFLGKIASVYPPGQTLWWGKQGPHRMRGTSRTCQYKSCGKWYALMPRFSQKTVQIFFFWLRYLAYVIRH